MVPSDWEIKQLDNVFKVYDSLHKTPTFSDDGYSMVRVTDIKGGYLDLSNTIKVSPEVFAEFTKKYKPKASDIVFSRVGSYGISSYAATDTPFCLGQNTVIAESNSSADSLYIFNVLKGQYVKRQIERTVDGSSHKTVSLKIIRNLAIPIPPLPEQRKIAKILSTWDKAISATERLIDNSKQQKKALMQQLLTGKKRLLDEAGKPFVGEWEEVKLSDVFTLSSGDTKPKDVEKEQTNTQCFPVFGGNNIMGYSAKSNSTGNVILIGRVGEYCGVTRLVQNDCWITDNALFTKKFSADFDKQFIVYLLQKFDLSRLRNKGGQPLISQKPIYGVKIEIPSLHEQQKVASVLLNADREIEVLQQQLADLKQEKKALMQQLLTGKRRVKT